MTKEEGFVKAVAAAGSQKALALALGLTPGAVHWWKRLGRIPHLRVLDVEKFTGVPREDLRPDLFPRDR